MDTGFIGIAISPSIYSHDAARTIVARLAADEGNLARRSSTIVLQRGK